MLSPLPREGGRLPCVARARSRLPFLLQILLQNSTSESGRFRILKILNGKAVACCSVLPFKIRAKRGCVSPNRGGCTCVGVGYGRGLWWGRCTSHASSVGGQRAFAKEADVTDPGSRGWTGWGWLRGPCLRRNGGDRCRGIPCGCPARPKGAMGAHKGRPYTKQGARFLPPQERQTQAVRGSCLRRNDGAGCGNDGALFSQERQGRAGTTVRGVSRSRGAR